MKVVKVDKGHYKNYLKKAQESFDSMNEDLEKRRWNSAVISAVHCVIGGADALTVFFRGERHAGERHEDVAKLLKMLEVGDDKKIQQLLNTLKLKNKAEYEDVLLSETDAKNAKKNTERFFNWVKEILGE